MSISFPGIGNSFPRIRQSVLSDWNSFPWIRQPVLSDCNSFPWIWNAVSRIRSLDLDNLFSCLFRGNELQSDWTSFANRGNELQSERTDCLIWGNGLHNTIKRFNYGFIFKIPCPFRALTTLYLRLQLLPTICLPVLCKSLLPRTICPLPDYPIPMSTPVTHKLFTGIVLIIAA